MCGPNRTAGMTVSAQVIEPAGSFGSSIEPPKENASLRFSIRSMLLSVALISIAIAFVVRGERQRRFISEFESLGATCFMAPDGYLDSLFIHFFPKGYLGRVEHVWLIGDGSKNLDPALSRLSELGPIESVRIGDIERRLIISESGLANLGRIATLKKISLCESYFYNDQIIAHLASVPFLEQLSINSHISVESLNKVLDLPELNWLSLRLDASQISSEVVTKLDGVNFVGLHISGADNELLARMKLSKTIKWLVSSYSSVTDDGMKDLSRMQEIETLFINGCKITDHGISELKKLKKLRRLSLSSTAISDASLGHLAEMKTLQYLWLERTEITDQGKATLRAALPGTQIH